MVNYQIFSNVNLVRIFNSTCITLLEILNFLTENPIKCSIVFHLISRLGPVISSAPDNQSCTGGTRHKILDTINSVNSRQEMPCSAPVQVWAQYRQHQGRSSEPDWQPPAPLLSLLWLTGPPWRNFRNQPMNGPPAFLRFCTHFLAKVRF